MYPAIRLMCSRTGRIGRLQNLDLYTCASYLICFLIVCFVCRHLSQSQQSFFYAISLKQCKNMLIPYFSLQDLSFGPYQIPWEALRSGWGPCWRPWPPWIPSSWVAPSCRAWSIRSSSSSPSCTYQNLGSLLCPLSALAVGKPRPLSLERTDRSAGLVVLTMRARVGVYMPASLLVLKISQTGCGSLLVLCAR